MSDVIDFPDFSAESAAELAAQQLAQKRLALPTGDTPASLEPWTRPLAAAPGWANGRDVETFVRRLAVECATRQATTVTPAALDAALGTVLNMKGGSSETAGGGNIERILLERDGLLSPPAPEPSPFMTAEPLFQGPPDFDIQKAIKLATMDGDDDDDEGDAEDELDLSEALEEAIVGLGYDEDDASRDELARLLADAVGGSAPFPRDIRDRVASKTGAPSEALDAALQKQAAPVLKAVKAAVAYRSERREQLEELDDKDREDALNDEARILERLRTMGPCPAGYSWFRSGNGWRCGGGSHFVYDDDPILNFD